MKNFFGEFKKFITRGNVVDMAVGVIVGSSFTAIVNALSNNILKPLINYLLAFAVCNSVADNIHYCLRFSRSGRSVNNHIARVGNFTNHTFLREVKIANDIVN